jgi:hypothetical protein
LATFVATAAALATFVATAALATFAVSVITFFVLVIAGAASTEGTANAPTRKRDCAARAEGE